MSRSRAWLVAILIGLVVAGIVGERTWRWVHRTTGGSWTSTNRLIDETSPYLLLHAHNPVDWYPWGPEALARAKREQKLIFLSIGYSTCYWCHVMERTVFSDPAIATLMNQWFINIKVDREERPDLDELYMAATQIITGSGGWPNSVFLTPDLKPFYAGTYFPPTDQHGLPGFPTVLRTLDDDWEHRRAEVLKYADAVTSALRAGLARADVDTVPFDRSLVAQAVTRLQRRYDAQDGGFGGAPKFPPTMELELLLADYQRTHDPQTLRIVTHTLDAMARGGVYDQVGGGFHRYATDARWRVPHFEKMLYNQADLSRVYLQAFRITRQEDYRRVAEDILTFVSREMRSPEGGFYSAIDSQTDGVEGQYSRWTEREVQAILGGEADRFLSVYALAPMPEGDGGVLSLTRPIEETARSMRMPSDELKRALTPMLGRLLRARQRRTPPLVDTKILAAWNGRMIEAYASAYAITGKPKYRDTAVTAADFVLQRLRTGSGVLQRTYRDGRIKYDAYQEDYAFLISGLLGLYRATGNGRWVQEAQRLADQMIARYWDARHGGFFFTASAGELPIRMKTSYDSALPSGNAVAARALMELAWLTGRPDYLDHARQTLQTFAGPMRHTPGRLTSMLLAVEASYFPRPDQTVIPSRTPNPEPRTLTQDIVHATLTLSTPRPSPGQTFAALIQLHIKPGWHINANPASQQDLIPVSVTFNADLPVDVVSISYPAGTPVTFGFADRPLSVYQGAVSLRAVLRLKPGVRPGQTGLLRGTLTYQACDDQRCLMPAETALSVTITCGTTASSP